MPRAVERQRAAREAVGVYEGLVSLQRVRVLPSWPSGIGNDRCVPDVVTQAVERLRVAGVELSPGLSDVSISRVQDSLGFVFGPEHREFLQTVLPQGGSWPDWRRSSAQELRRRLDWPIDGVVFDVHHSGFWPQSWGDRPDSTSKREVKARSFLRRVPTLVPVYSHRYLASDPAFAPSPVFSVHQSDVIYYGDDLLDYVAREFGVSPFHPAATRTYVPFWSDLADGAENADL